ncbi:MAG TPA: inositol monophosphatase family protein [Anaerolineae bacterium]|nr:inositol monophosphatase family protein [Anaerolineae bacterium]
MDVSYLNTAIEAARTAAGVALERFHKPLVVSQKGFRDIVTEADLAAQTAAVGVIRSRFPHAAILGEEGLTPPARAEQLWVIDPIDGTTNYARGLPFFCVSIGVVQGAQPAAGAIYDPSRDHLFTAARGQGAWLNGMPIHVSDVRVLSDAILALDWSHLPADRQRSLALLNRLATECRSVRAIGSAALALSYLATGWIDLFFNLALRPWDGAAAQVIVEEAGGRITNPRGEVWDYTQPSALASNGPLHFAFDAFE